MRIEVMDEFGIDRQVLTLASPPVEFFMAESKAATDLAIQANDEIAEMASRHPQRFIPVEV